jgi:hypothetical protein
MFSVVVVGFAASSEPHKIPLVDCCVYHSDSLRFDSLRFDSLRFVIRSDQIGSGRKIGSMHTTVHSYSVPFLLQCG